MKKILVLMCVGFVACNAWSNQYTSIEKCLAASHEYCNNKKNRCPVKAATWCKKHTIDIKEAKSAKPAAKTR